MNRKFNSVKVVKKSGNSSANFYRLACLKINKATFLCGIWFFPLLKIPALLNYTVCNLNKICLINSFTYKILHQPQIWIRHTVVLIIVLWNIGILLHKQAKRRTIMHTTVLWWKISEIEFLSTTREFKKKTFVKQ